MLIHAYLPSPPPPMSQLSSADNLEFFHWQLNHALVSTSCNVVHYLALVSRMSLVGYDDKTVRSRLTPWDHSTAGALRFVAREKQRLEVGRGG